MTRRRKAAGLVLLCCLAARARSAEGPPSPSAPTVYVRPTELNLSEGWFRIPSAGDESVGLTRLSLDFDFDSGLVAGPGLLAATFGKRGGLFGLGAEVGWNLPLPGSLALKPRVFVGAAGGAGTPVGGGLLWGPSVAFSREFSGFSIGAGWAWLDFSNGGFSSGEPFASLSIPSDFSYTDPSYDGAPLLRAGDGAAWSSHAWRAIPTVQWDLAGGSYGTVGLAGLEVQRFLGTSWFADGKILGAVSSGEAGFAALGAGLGRAFPLGAGASLSPKLDIGAAGGKGVDTGGGFFVEPAAELRLRLGERSSVQVSGGWLDAPSGGFRGPTVGLGLSADFETLSPSALAQSPTEAPGPAGTGLCDWRFSASGQTYRLSSQGPGLSNVDLFGFELDWLASKWIFLSGSAYFPYDGNAAGYAAFLLGAGLRLPLTGPLSLEVQGKAGPAGGGGLPTGSGGLLMATAGLDVRVLDRLSVYAAFGRLEFTGGGVSSSLEEAGLRTSFALPVR